jgi:hypothetical protein
MVIASSALVDLVSALAWPVLVLVAVVVLNRPGIGAFVERRGQ